MTHFPFVAPYSVLGTPKLTPAMGQNCVRIGSESDFADTSVTRSKASTLHLPLHTHCLPLWVSRRLTIRSIISCRATSSAYSCRQVSSLQPFLPSSKSFLASALFPSFPSTRVSATTSVRSPGLDLRASRDSS